MEMLEMTKAAHLVDVVCPLFTSSIPSLHQHRPTMSLTIFIRSPSTFSERKFPASLTIDALKVRPRPPCFSFEHV